MVVHYCINHNGRIYRVAARFPAEEDSGHGGRDGHPDGRHRIVGNAAYRAISGLKFIENINIFGLLVIER